MLSYQHDYHAGNIADVFKHLALTHIIQYLYKKEKPCFLLDTHAGAGMYNLYSERAQKTGEAEESILALWPNIGKLSPLCVPYLQAIQAYNPTKTLKRYPGSFAIMQYFLRSYDRLFGCELHPEAFQSLQKIIDVPNAHVKQTDGYEQLLATLPPVERRGLIFIDPSYEIKSEYQRVAEVVAACLKRFATGTYCIWYPILVANLQEKLLSKLEKIPNLETNHIKLFWQNSKMRMQGSGLWIINPPYTFSSEMEQVLMSLQAVMPHLKLHFEIK